MIEIVVVCRKRTSHRSTCLSLEYRCLNLVKSLGLEKSTHLTYHLGSELESRKSLIAREEVEIALTVEGFLV